MVPRHAGQARQGVDLRTGGQPGGEARQARACSLAICCMPHCPVPDAQHRLRRRRAQATRVQQVLGTRHPVRQAAWRGADLLLVAAIHTAAPGTPSSMPQLRQRQRLRQRVCRAEEPHVQGPGRRWRARWAAPLLRTEQPSVSCSPPQEHFVRHVTTAACQLTLQGVCDAAACHVERVGGLKKQHTGELAPGTPHQRHDQGPNALGVCPHILATRK